MARLTIIVEADADPTRTDPHEVAEAIVYSYENDRDHGAGDDPEVTFVDAVWEAS